MNLPDFSPRAVADLDGILAFIARDKPQAAAKLVARLKHRCCLVADFPELGTRREDLMEGLRSSSVGNYLIYYRPVAGRVRIERVLHAARDVDKLFG